jgi:hypothetical protein
VVLLRSTKTKTSERVVPAVASRSRSSTGRGQHEVEPHLIGTLLGHKDSRMVERVYGRMPVQSLGRALERRRTRHGP